LTPKKAVKDKEPEFERTPPRPRSATKSSALSVSPGKLEVGSFGLQLTVTPRVKKVYKMVVKRNQLGGNGTTGAIYGELTMGSMQKVVNLMVNKCGLTHTSRVIDVGAGLGKPNLHFAQDPGCRLSLGVELEDIRWRLSMFILDGILPEMEDGLEQESRRRPKSASRPEVSDSSDSSDDDVNDPKLYAGVNFVQGDIDDAASTDPFTHIYMYDLGFPPPLQQSIARKFNNSVHATHLVSYRPPRRVIDEYGYKVEFIDSINTSMFGSGENHTAYFYKRINREGIHSLVGSAPTGTTKITIKARPGFAEKDVDVACSDCYVRAVKAAVGDVRKLEKSTREKVKAHMNAERPKRERKPSRKALAAL